MVADLKTTQKHRVRQRLRERDGDRCWYCFKVMDFTVVDASAKNRATLEHLRDRSRGGTNDIANLVLAHGRCNSSASVLTLPEKHHRRNRWCRRNLRREFGIKVHNGEQGSSVVNGRGDVLAGPFERPHQAIQALAAVEDALFEELGFARPQPT